MSNNAIKGFRMNISHSTYMYMEFFLFLSPEYINWTCKTQLFL